LESGSSTMTLEEAKKRFVDEVKLRGYDDKYIDRKEEREILQIALTAGISFESARAALAQVCEAQGYVLESKVIERLKDILDTSAGNDGSIDEKEFNDAVLNCKKWTNGKKTDVQCKRMVIEIIDEAAYKTTKGWFSNWYANVKREVGM
ncbi:MAG: hypothetical protein NZO58_02935, partial [Gemmataceae bacterium]|nr:hypothetical protein [Gemmataceae bacterium]